MYKSYIPLTFFLLILSTVSFAQGRPGEIEVVDRFIAQQAKIEKGEEYKDAREIIKGDVNRDRKNDLAVVYTLEGFNGSNNYRQYLAVFLGIGNGFRFAAKEIVGQHAGRGVKLVSITNGRIHLDTMEPRKNDPACCPSKPGKTSFVFRGRRLSEIRERN